MKLFSMYDVKARNYIQPFSETSTIAALRGFEVAVNDGKSTFNRFPDDFCLMELGDFDSETGLITPATSPINLGSCRSVLRPAPEQNSLPFSRPSDETRTTQ